MSAERRRLTLTLLLSLLIHALLLSLTFGGQGLGFPGFAFPWRERRIEAPDLRVVLMPAQATTAKPVATPVKEPLQQQVSSEQTVAAEPAPEPPVSSVLTLGRAEEAIVPKAKEMARAEPVPKVTTVAAPGQAPLHSEVSGDAPPTQNSEPAVIAMEQSDEAVPSTVIAVAPSTPSQETVVPAPPDTGKAAQKQAEAEMQEQAVEVANPDPSEREAQRKTDALETQRQEFAHREAARLAAAALEAQRRATARQEAARAEAARLAAQRQEAARLTAAKIEAQRLEAVRQEAARIEAARLEDQRQEAARQAAVQQEVQRQEAARQEAARAAAARQEAHRQEAARQAAAQLEAQRLEATRQAAAQQEAVRVLAEQEAEARREARLRAIGRQLDEEAARRKAASADTRPSSKLPRSLSTTRRARLWGRADPNVELVQYAEALARKIQFNTPVETVREVAKQPHTNPMVTLAIRSDGFVESVIFVVSSGVEEVDKTIQRIVQNHAPYPAFPPGLARQYDVIEIRRTWHFDTIIQLD